MPHLSFSTPVNGFYEDAMKKDPRGRVVLYAKISSNSHMDVDQFNKKNVVTLDKGYKNNFYPIAITSFDTPLAIVTQYDWQTGGNLMEHIATQFKKGTHDFQSALTNFLSNFDKIVQEITGGNGVVDDALMNQITKKYHRKIFTASESFKRYNGSSTTINLPALEFTFPAEDFLGTHLNRAFTLLSYLLPIVGTDEDKEGQTDPRVRKKSWMYEEAPNGYVSPYSGFDTSLIEGTFAIDYGGNIVKDLIPVNISLTQSKTKVLSEYDYYFKAKNLSSYLGSEFKTWKRNKDGDVEIISKDAHPAKLFYSNMGMTYQDLTKCQASVHVPSVIRISVNFEFAKKITPKDYQDTFFQYDKFNLLMPDEASNPNINKVFNELPQSVKNTGTLMTNNRVTQNKISKSV